MTQVGAEVLANNIHILGPEGFHQTDASGCEYSLFLM